jgi:ribosome-binding factor A
MRRGPNPRAHDFRTGTMTRSSGSGPSQRMLRVGEQVRHALSDMLSRGEIMDPLIETSVISISEVRMSPDLKIATAFVSPIGAADDDAVVAGLNHHAKFIRGRVTHALRQMKYMPQFRFKLDTSFDNFSRIDGLLKSPEVARDLDAGRNDPDKNEPDNDNKDD